MNANDILPLLLPKSNSLERMVRGEILNDKIKKRLKMRNKFFFDKECRELSKNGYPDPKEVELLKIKYGVKLEDFE